MNWLTIDSNFINVTFNDFENVLFFTKGMYPDLGTYNSELDAFIIKEVFYSRSEIMNDYTDYMIIKEPE